MEKLSYNDKLCMQTLCEQGLGEKAIIFSYPGKAMSSVKKVRSQVDRTQPLYLCKPGSEGPATTSACAVCCCKAIFPLVRPTKLQNNVSKRQK